MKKTIPKSSSKRVHYPVGMAGKVTVTCTGRESTDKEGVFGELFGVCRTRDELRDWAIVLWDDEDTISLYNARLILVEETNFVPLSINYPGNPKLPSVAESFGKEKQED